MKMLHTDFKLNNYNSVCCLLKTLWFIQGQGPFRDKDQIPVNRPSMSDAVKVLSDPEVTANVYCNLRIRIGKVA